MTFQRQMIDSGVRVINDNYKQWRACVRKKSYSHLSDAKHAALATGHGRPYFCDDCAGFHVGHSSLPALPKPLDAEV